MDNSSSKRPRSSKLRAHASSVATCPTPMPPLISTTKFATIATHLPNNIDLKNGAHVKETIINNIILRILHKRNVKHISKNLKLSKNMKEDKI